MKKDGFIYFEEEIGYSVLEVCMPQKAGKKTVNLP